MRNFSTLPWQKPTPRLRYDHMLWYDGLVWSEILRHGHYAFERVAYDVKCGTPIPQAPDASAADLALADGTGSKRIDVVAELARELWVIEVKPFGNHAALGQALMYRALFLIDYRPPKPVRAAIACGEPDVDIFPLCVEHDVIIIATNAPDFLTGSR